MASTKLVLWKYRQKKDGTCSLAIRITKDRKTQYIHTGYFIHEKDWNPELSNVRKSYPNSARLNNLLLKRLSEVNDSMLESETLNKDVSSREVKKKIKKKSRTNSFFKFAADRIEGKFLSGVFSVAKSERSLLCNIEEFTNLKKSQSLETAKAEILQRKRERISKGRQPGYSFLEEVKLIGKKQNLFFEDINEAFLNQFKIFCASHLGMKTRSITNHLMFIRTLFNDAISEGIVEAKYYPFAGDKEKIRLGTSQKIGLTKEEVRRIEALNLEPETQIWHTRNVWLFAYYFAGIRVSDVVKLKWSDIKSGRLYYVMDKNEKPVSLKVPDKAKAILECYKDRKNKKTIFVFPHMDKANLKDEFDVFVKVRNATSLLNDYLKQIASMCDIDKNLSNHIARHTFGNIAGDNVHPLMLQKLYRHTELKTTIGYQANFITKPADDALESVIG
ncbi:integrase [Roseivirga seohaensis]|uniref:Integrase n=1 Tax=Roseivirga seohaensis TaxID=1914963 RepID=A0A150XKV3_9BACT|nr:phage integrase SAM-like domain-containing protein [Roseivirga seohaensis]KYG79343.1 integrase [Roseivirga seohaensis]